MNSIQRRVVTGTQLGIALGAASSLFLLPGWGIHSLGQTFAGASTAPPFADAPVRQLLIAYFAGGIAAGILGTVLWPRIRTSTQAVLIGFVSAIPFFFAIRVAVRGVAYPSVLAALHLLLVALIGGGIVALICWRWRYGPPPASRQRLQQQARRWRLLRSGGTACIPGGSKHRSAHFQKRGGRDR